MRNRWWRDDATSGFSRGFLERFDRELLKLQEFAAAGRLSDLQGLAAITCWAVTHKGYRIGTEPNKLLGPGWKAFSCNADIDLIDTSPLTWNAGEAIEQGYLTNDQVCQLRNVLCCLVRFRCEDNIHQAEVYGRDLGLAIERYLQLRGFRVRDSFGEVAAFARAKLRGKSARIITLVIQAGGSIPITDLAVDIEIDWNASEHENEWNSAKNRINQQLKAIDWRLAQRDHQAVLNRITDQK